MPFGPLRGHFGPFLGHFGPPGHKRLCWRGRAPKKISGPPPARRALARLLIFLTRPNPPGRAGRWREVPDIGGPGRTCQAKIN